jgi:N-acetylglucosamine-6-phosphate deacetylase
MLDACGDVRDSWQIAHGSRIGGVHLYGPYFAEDKVGCHNANQCRAPKASEFGPYFRQGIVRVATCAAELPGAAAFYRRATRNDCLVTCGHSNATWSEMEAAFKHGMRHVDHFWCAMSSVPSVRDRLGVPMQGSMLEYVLDNPEMSTEVIADGMHLSPELLRFAWKMKTSKRLCLVTDCNRALDMPPGRYRFGPKSDGSWFKSDGKVGWAATGGSLASAVTGMDHMVKTMHRLAKIPLVEAVRMASLTPAERTGIESSVGSLRKGKQANVVVMSRQLRVKRVYIDGQPAAM